MLEAGAGDWWLTLKLPPVPLIFHHSSLPLPLIIKVIDSVLPAAARCHHSGKQRWQIWGEKSTRERWRRRAPGGGLRYLCGLGSLCLSLSCLIILKRPMRTSGRDTFIPFRVILQEEREGRRGGFSAWEHIRNNKYVVVSMFCALCHCLISLFCSSAAGGDCIFHTGNNNTSKRLRRWFRMNMNESELIYLDAGGESANSCRLNTNFCCFLDPGERLHAAFWGYLIIPPPPLPELQINAEKPLWAASSLITDFYGAKRSQWFDAGSWEKGLDLQLVLLNQAWTRGRTASDWWLYTSFCLTSQWMECRRRERQICSA